MENTPHNTNDTVLLDIFGPMIPYIMRMDADNGYTEIHVPHTMVIDKDIILRYFHEDAMLGYSRSTYAEWPPRVLVGTLKDQAVITHLHDRWMEYRQVQRENHYYDLTFKPR